MLLKNLLAVLKLHNSLKLIHTVKKYLKNIGQTYLFTMTSKHLQQDLFSGTSYVPGFLVRTSVQQAEVKASRKNPDRVYFTNSSESYAWYDQNSLSWKTWQRSLITDWTSYSGSFPKQGTMQNGQLYLQVHWEPPTDVQDGGALPTPTASDVEGGVAKDVQYKNGHFFRENKQGVRWGVKLRDALHSLPTPTARDYKGRSSEKWNQEYGQRNIPDILTQTGDHMSVSPYFLEEVMGYPIGWTELKH